MGNRGLSYLKQEYLGKSTGTSPGYGFVQKQLRITVHKAVAERVTSNEAGVVTKRGKSKIRSAEITFLKSAEKYSRLGTVKNAGFIVNLQG
jgi:hypothetical protein